MATLAGVSIDYLVRLEQGRDTNPSIEVLQALGEALRLTPEEQRHLVLLAKVNGAEGQLCPASSPPIGVVSSTVRVLLDRLEPTPSFVLGPADDVLAWNRTWEHLVRPIGLLDDPVRTNLVRFTFVDEVRARAAYPDWETEADVHVANLRTASILLSDQPGFTGLVEELRGHPAFATRWDSHGVAAKRTRTKAIVHPDVGELRLDVEILSIEATGGQRMVTWLPADDATEDAMRRAVSTPTGGLRAV